MELNFEKSEGMIPTVVQDAATNEILMLAYMNPEAYQNTVSTGLATFFSRSRNKIWIKGESSGHTLEVLEILTDCDQDAVVLKVKPNGPGVCHEGYRSCFFRTLKAGNWQVTGELGFDKEAVYGGKA